MRQNGYIAISGCQPLLQSPGHTLIELAVIENALADLRLNFDPISCISRDLITRKSYDYLTM